MFNSSSIVALAGNILFAKFLTKKKNGWNKCIKSFRWYVVW